MRKPNGFGTIVRLPGARRRPYALIATTGYRNGRQMRKPIGYYATQKEALQAQLELGNGLIALNANEATFADVYERFKKTKFPHVGEKQREAYNCSFSDFAILHNKKFRDIRKSDMQIVIDDCKGSYSKKSKLRTLCTQMYKFAIEEDVVNKNYALNLNVGKPTSTNPHEVIPEKEVKILLENVGDRFIDYLVILLFTGMRMNELANVKVQDVHLKERYLIGGSKTEAGTNRVIPLHEFIVPLVERNIGKKTLFEEDGKSLPQYTVRTRLIQVKEKYGLTFKNHDTRKTFVSIAYEQQIPKLTVQRIVGHKGQDVTENAYTDISLKLLLNAAEKFGQHSIFVNYLFTTTSNANKRTAIS